MITFTNSASKGVKLRGIWVCDVYLDILFHESKETHGLPITALL